MEKDQKSTILQARVPLQRPRHFTIGTRTYTLFIKILHTHTVAHKLSCGAWLLCHNTHARA